MKSWKQNLSKRPEPKFIPFPCSKFYKNLMSLKGSNCAIGELADHVAMSKMFPATSNSIGEIIQFMENSGAGDQALAIMAFAWDRFERLEDAEKNKDEALIKELCDEIMEEGLYERDTGTPEASDVDAGSTEAPEQGTASGTVETGTPASAS